LSLVLPRPPVSIIFPYTTLFRSYLNFMGRLCWVAAGEHGVHAVVSTELREPQTVIGSYLHEHAWPEEYEKHKKHNKELEEARERSEEHTSELQSLAYLVCRLLLE